MDLTVTTVTIVYVTLALASHDSHWRRRRQQRVPTTSAMGLFTFGCIFELSGLIEHCFLAHKKL